jgi:hypothetical protein
MMAKWAETCSEINIRLFKKKYTESLQKDSNFYRMNKTLLL